MKKGSLTEINVNLKDIKEARVLLKDLALYTPMKKNRHFSAMTGNSIYLKMENMQHTGSFKYRGARVKLLSLKDEEKKRGVITASAGNHAQGVASNAQQLGIKATIVMPEGTPLVKIEATKGYGADVILFGDSFYEAFQHASELREKKDFVFIHPFEDPKIIAGQGTIGLELLEQAPELDVVVVPVGGGGVISGIAIALKSLKPTIKVIGVQASNAPSMYRSFKSGKIEAADNEPTIAEGIAVKQASPVMLDILKEYVDDIVIVEEEEIASAILLLMERSKVVVEGAGASSLAAMLFHNDKIKNKNVGVVLTGGNIDVNIISRIIESGLAKSGRLVRINVLIIDKPGGLQKLTKILMDQRANIMHVLHNRLSPDMPIGQTEVSLTLETRGHDHIESIISDLISKGYKVTRQK